MCNDDSTLPVLRAEDSSRSSLLVLLRVVTQRDCRGERRREREEMAGEVTAEELPRAIVRRVVKEKLSKLSTVNDINLHKEALLAFSESARIFIHYLSATANDLCKESGRQTINAEDVLKALEEIEFPEFSGPLRAALNEFRKKKAGKIESSAKTKESNKKRKSGEEAAAENGGSDAQNDNENESSEENNYDADN